MVRLSPCYDGFEAGVDWAPTTTAAEIVQNHFESIYDGSGCFDWRRYYMGWSVSAFELSKMEKLGH